MDKSWIDLANRKCENRYLYVRLVVRQHLRDNGFWKKYKKWDKHGESKDNADTLGTDQNDIVTDSYMEDDMVRLVQEALGTPNIGPHDQNDGESSTNPRVGPDEPTKKFLKLREEYRLKPKTLSGVDIDAQLKSNGILTEYKREDLERRNVIQAQKPDNDSKSILFLTVPATESSKSGAFIVHFGFTGSKKRWAFFANKTDPSSSAFMKVPKLCCWERGIDKSLVLLSR
ncbi:hypothetical protein M0R45_009557 [Rubus argutus]|uniref:Transposase-associated domain-containing protein n=1 Tax=Rubus argutus TaxID=59490 RepID=A0AAW1Y4I1_RUBAR